MCVPVHIFFNHLYSVVVSHISHYKYFSFSWGLSATSGGSKGGEVTSEPDSPLSLVWSAADQMTQTVSTTVSFTEIVQDEQEQKEAWQRAANKPLSLIQVTCQFYSSQCMYVSKVY